MVRVLHCIGGFDLGGAETMVMNIHQHIDRQKIQFDYVISGIDKGYYEEKAKELGARLFHIRKHSESFLGSYMDLYKVVKGNQYTIVHLHTQNAFLTFFSVLASRLAGAKCVITHSHNTSDWRKGLLLKLHFLFKPILKRMVTIRLSCGADAASWLYGDTENVEIIPLPVVCDKYLFSPEKYRTLREKYGYRDETVYVHTGRFSDQKNHQYLIDIFHEIYRGNNKSRLVLLGDGELRNVIEKKVENLGLQNAVTFCGNVTDVGDRLIAADVFLLPSKYEGFPTVALEAQAAGLPCYLSDTITPAIAVTDLVHFLPLNGEPEKWADEILKQHSGQSMRQDYNVSIREDYDISRVTRRFENIYGVK